MLAVLLQKRSGHPTQKEHDTHGADLAYASRPPEKKRVGDIRDVTQKHNDPVHAHGDPAALGKAPDFGERR